MTLVDLVVAALATFRLAHLLAYEDGPADLVRRWRLAVGAVETSLGFSTAPTAWGRLWLCPLCLSVWIALAVVALWYLAPAAWPVVQVLAVSGTACALHLVVRKIP